ncbi:hypothetical protein LJY25_03545 [Hymenobacter sp. BT175]|uniref:hypothetical protein n=1 Tax=Hymenobacter translucens TaxID=2886507 RepID=UPI001D0E1C44|nr:hypothetical protein [Hymenobacter translucens]MCC2545505.1 hypothetical protein [Hymenobacter translucens]
MIKAIFFRQLDAMHQQLEQRLPLETIDLHIDAISWQTVLNEATETERSRIDRRYLGDPVYRNVVWAYNDVTGRNSVGMLITLFMLVCLMFSHFLFA